MSDLLPLRGDDRPLRPRRRRGRRRLAALLVLLLAVALAAGAVVVVRRVLGSFQGPADYAGQGTGEVVVQVHTGDTASAIATSLLTDGVVKSVAAFRAAADKDDRSRSVQPGFYRLRTRMSAASAVSLLLDPAARVRSRVTLPEGLTLSDALTKIAASTELKLADLQQAVTDPTGLGLPDYAKAQAEGFLFPATYDVEPSASATAALKTMVARYTDAAGKLDLATASAAIGHTPYEVLTTASLIEKETAFPADRARVARVIYNRLAIDMPLQLDSTVNYIRTEKKARLTNADTRQESAYNTYLNKGLPPTPIDSPGEAALEAALAPAPGNWLYFVTVSKDGSSLFTNNYAEFTAAAAKARKDGIY